MALDLLVGIGVVMEQSCWAGSSWVASDMIDGWLECAVACCVRAEEKPAQVPRAIDLDLPSFPFYLALTDPHVFLFRAVADVIHADPRRDGYSLRPLEMAL